jgi:hypothetical protein
MTKKKAKPKPTAPPPYSPTPEERAAIEKAFEERKIAPAPRLKVENNQIAIDHPDKVTGHLLMENALGIESKKAAPVTVTQDTKKK